MTEEMQERRMNRRSLLKKAAVGGAAAWGAAPFLTSTASAANSSNCTTRKFGSVPCGNCSGGFFQCNTKNGTACYCFTGNNGLCYCKGNAFCSQIPTCTTNAQCKAFGGRGWVCITVNGCTGCGSGGVCVPPCGHGIASLKGGASNKTAIG